MTGLDRAVGVLLGAAAGDALGVPYKHGSRALPARGEPARMLGGGLGGHAPGRWSAGTELACVIAEVAATGADLRDEAALDRVAAGFLHRHARTSRPAGSGSLVRTGPVALAHLGDPDAVAHAARAVSGLTHHDRKAGDACVLWSLAIDHAVRTGELDVRVGLAQVGPEWPALLDEAERARPERFAATDGRVVTALQAAWSTVVRAGSLADGLNAAVRGGGDTDTVAAIAGALLGARFGGSAVPARWRRVLHGRSGLRARELTRLAFLAARRGRPDRDGWPSAPRLAGYAGASRRTVPHPDDPGVLLGAVGALRPGVADAVVSLCRLGSEQAPLAGVPAGDHVEVWLVDDDDANLDVAGVVADTASVIRDLRAEGKTVLLHCVHAMSRTPVVAAAYGAIVTGSAANEALRRVCAVLPSACPRPALVAALRR